MIDISTPNDVFCMVQEKKTRIHLKSLRRKFALFLKDWSRQSWMWMVWKTWWIFFCKARNSARGIVMIILFAKVDGHVSAVLGSAGSAPPTDINYTTVQKMAVKADQPAQFIRLSHIVFLWLSHGYLIRWCLIKVAHWRNVGTFFLPFKEKKYVSATIHCIFSSSVEKLQLL